MHRSQRAELLRLRRAVERSRAAACLAREELIESLGDFMCGGGRALRLDELEALVALQLVQARAEACYTRYLAVVAEAVVMHAQQQYRPPQHRTGP